MSQPTDAEKKLRQSAIREGIKMERQRVVAMLMSGLWKNEPCQDAAMLIANGQHWEELK